MFNYTNTKVPGPGAYDVDKPIGSDSRKACFAKKPHYINPNQNKNINEAMYNINFANELITEIKGSHTFGHGNKGLFLKNLVDNPGPKFHIFNNSRFPGPGKHNFIGGFTNNNFITGKRRSTHGKMYHPSFAENTNDDV